MKLSIVAFSAMLSVTVIPAFGQQKDFQLKIGEQTVEIDAGDTVDIALPDGSKTTATLTRNEFATYATDTFSFRHPGTLGVSRSDLGDGIVQHALMTALGTMTLVQTYSALDPSNLKEMMLQVMIKDGVAAGSTIEREPVTRRVNDQELQGLKATERSGDDVTDYEVFASGNGSSGIIIITRIDRENLVEDGPVAAKFWETLKFSQ